MSLIPWLQSLFTVRDSAGDFVVPQLDDAGRLKVAIDSSGPLVKLFQGVDTQGGLTVTNVAQVIPMDFESIKDDYYVHSTTVNPGEVTIQQVGWYKISAMMTVGCVSSSGGTRGNPVLNIEVDTGSGFQAQPDKMGGYIREDSSNELSTSITGIGLFFFNGGDKLRLTVRDTALSEPDEETLPYSQRLIIEYIDRTGAASGTVDNLKDIGDVNASAPADGDSLVFDSATSKWMNGDPTDPDAIHDNVAGEIAAVTPKSPPALADVVLVEDSEDGNSKKKVAISDLLSVTPVQQYVTVAKNGAQFTNIQSAIDSITDASSNKRYAVFVYAGDYAENVVMKDYVDLVGVDGDIVRITPASGAALTLGTGDSNLIRIGVECAYGALTANEKAIVINNGTHRICNCEIIVSSTSGNYTCTAIDHTGGTIEVCRCTLTYTRTGDTIAMQQNVISSSFPGTTFTNNSITGNILSGDDHVNGIVFTGSSGDYNTFKDNVLQVSNAGSGECVGINITSGNIRFARNAITISSNSGNSYGGRVTGTSLQTVTAFNILSSSSTSGSSYTVDVGSSCTLSSFFDYVPTGTGQAGTGTFNLITALAPGTLALSGSLTDGVNSLTVANAKAAFDHTSLTNNPHSVTKSQLGVKDETIVPVRNETGGTLVKGTAVYASGWDGTESLPLVARADKDDEGKRPAIGLILNDINDNNNGEIILAGAINGINTSSWSISDQLVLGTNGALTRPPPDADPFTGEVQNIAIVASVDASEGVLIMSVDGQVPIPAEQIFILYSSELDKTVDPTVNDDSGDGYKVGSRWINVTDNKEFVCLDNSAGAAVWSETTVTTVATHASTHESGGSDPIKLDDLASPDDNTDLDATTSAHGLLPKLGGGSENYLRADGTWDKPPGNAGVFGADYQSIISSGRSTTTSSTFQSKVSLVTPALTGTYRVGWTAIVDCSSASTSNEYRLYNTTDTALIGGLIVMEFKDPSNRDCVGGFAEVVFTGSSKTFQIQHRVQSANTSGIQEARIELWRVS